MKHLVPQPRQPRSSAMMQSWQSQGLHDPKLPKPCQQQMRNYKACLLNTGVGLLATGWSNEICQSSAQNQPWIQTELLVNVWEDGLRPTLLPCSISSSQHVCPVDERDGRRLDDLAVGQALGSRPGAEVLSGLGCCGSAWPYLSAKRRWNLNIITGWSWLTGPWNYVL